MENKKPNVICVIKTVKRNNDKYPFKEWLEGRFYLTNESLDRISSVKSIRELNEVKELDYLVSLYPMKKFKNQNNKIIIPTDRMFLNTNIGIKLLKDSATKQFHSLEYDKLTDNQLIIINYK